MAFTTVSKVKQGDYEIDPSNGTITVSDEWLVISDTANDSYESVLTASGLPAQYSAHPSAGAVLKTYTVKQDDNSEKIWHVFTNYDNLPGNQDRDQGEDPVNWPDRVSATGVPRKVVVSSWYFKTGFDTYQEQRTPILNSVGMEFSDLPLVDVYDQEVTIKRYVRPIPHAHFSYQGKLNSSTFTVRGKSYPKHTCRLRPIGYSDVITQGELSHYEMTYKFVYNENGWDLWTPDMGLYEGDYAQGIIKRIKDSENQPVSSPVLLDGNGAKIDMPTRDDAVILEGRVFEEADFNNLGFPVT
jgi:hypothetical protein